MRILVNAIPLTRVATGIGRYLRSLYAEIERAPGVEVGYFDGRGVSPRMPQAPAGGGGSGALAGLFWRLPPRLALAVREALHARAARAFARIGPGWDVYHEASFFPFPAPPGARTVFTVHDLSLDRHPQWHPRERVMFHARHARAACAGVDRFIAVSGFTRREMAEVWGLEPARISVTLLAHDPTRFAPPSEEAVRGLRERLGLPERYFLAVGSGDPRKNVDLALEALGLAGLDEPLAMAGWRGWDASGRTGARVLPLGYVDDEDLFALYGGALALVYPSLYEGFGLPVVEAMACGCPVVASAEASLPEACGGAALVLPDVRDSSALAGHLSALASDPALRAALRERGLARAARLSWARTAEATLDAFRAALAGA